MTHRVHFSEYGDPGGRLVIYFHGVPGALAEASIFDEHAKKHHLRLICLDRFSVDVALDRTGYVASLAREIDVLADGKPVDIIGFSLGTYVALEVVMAVHGQVGQVHLVSCAAPLDSGDYLSQMAGGTVFRLAKKNPVLFSLLTRCQKALAIVAPWALFRMLFSGSAGEDRSLGKQVDFKRYMTAVLADCFRNHVSGYARDVEGYVRWPDNFYSMDCTVDLWHGTQDNWSPPSMAIYFSQSIPGATPVHSMEGLSHYSCLYAAAPKICAQLERP